MRSYYTRQIDSESFATCKICHEHLPINHYSTEGDTLICTKCDTDYRLDSVYPARISILQNGYQDSYIHDTPYWD